MRESFLRELMLLQEKQEEKEKGTRREADNQEHRQHQTTSTTNTNTAAPLPQESQVNVTFFSDSGTATGRTLSGSFVACDKNLTHIIVNDLITPVGTRSSALIRLSDVIAISYY